MIRLCCDRNSDDCITVNILSGSNVSSWLKSMHVDAKKKETYVRASTVETKHFDKLRSEIEHHHNDDSMRTAIYAHVKNGILSSSQQCFARVMNRLMVSDENSEKEENQDQSTKIGLCVKFDRLQARIRENRPYTKLLGVPYVVV